MPRPSNCKQKGQDSQRYRSSVPGQQTGSVHLHMLKPCKLANFRHLPIRNDTSRDRTYRKAAAGDGCSNHKAEEILGDWLLRSGNSQCPHYGPVILHSDNAEDNVAQEPEKAARQEQRRAKQLLLPFNRKLSRDSLSSPVQRSMPVKTL